MQRLLIFSLLCFSSGFFSVYQSVGQVKICDNEESQHPVDIRALRLRDSLKQKAIDTIIVYRDWLGTNGFNGYGKVIWLNMGQCFQFKIDYERKDGDKIKSVALSRLKNDSIFQFFFYNHIDTVSMNPTKQAFRMDHDAEHFIEVDYGSKKYCYLISGLIVRFNPDNLRAEFVRLLTDTDFSLSIFGTRVNPITEDSIKSNKKN
ncbi:MAG TPA: hypothetical protein VE978_00190 [Chitinophagales bacterium]|nr:hypothetical protein [Chitinophagales bacterium]